MVRQGGYRCTILGRAHGSSPCGRGVPGPGGPYTIVTLRDIVTPRSFDLVSP